MCRRDFQTLSDRRQTWPCEAWRMPRRNRVDPWGDLHAVGDRGLFTGNRGCLVDETGRVRRHHVGSLWITCVTELGGRRMPLAAPGRWTPLFFLDDAVALAAGHRPCAYCRRDDYLCYRDAVTESLGASRPLFSTELNRRLGDERHSPGRGLERAGDRKLWSTDIDKLPSGSVIVVDDGQARVLLEDRSLAFGFGGWSSPRSRPRRGRVTVLTPPTSVAALLHGFAPTMHPSAAAT